MTTRSKGTSTGWAGLTHASQINVAGMLVAIIGIVIQIAAGVDYPTIPPGPIVLAVASAVVVFRPRRWSRYVGVIVPAFLLIGGTIASFARDELWDTSEPAQFIGLFIQAAAQAVALAAGLRALREPSS